MTDEGPGEAPPTFEEALRRLDEVVARLESGEVGLEEAVALFEQRPGLPGGVPRAPRRRSARIEELTAEDLPAAPGEPPAGEPEPPF